MASFICHVVGGTKRVRVERTVRRDHRAEVTARQGRLNRSLDGQAHLAELSVGNFPKPRPLGRSSLRVHAPASVAETGSVTL